MNTKSDSLLSILNTLIKPALGCTEIGIVAYACGVCSKYATGKITSVDVKVSQYVFRNVACVGVPNLGFCGIKTIVAGGLFVKEPEKKLQILSSIKQEDIPAIKKLLPYINVEVVKNVDPVYTSVLLKTDKGEVIESLIEQIHDNLIYVKYNGKDINISYLQNKKTIDEQSSNEKKYKCSDFSLNDIYDFSNKCNSNDIDFLFEADKLNELLVDYGEKNNPSTSLGKVFSKTIDGKENWEDKILIALSNAVSTRMAGCPLVVDSSNGSGDHGLTVTIPLYIYSEIFKLDKIELLRACAFSHLILWKIKQNIGDLSAWCGSVVGAVVASAAGIAYLQKLPLASINKLINFLLCSFGGILCDGAKPSCSNKIFSAYASAFTILRLEHYNIDSIGGQGIINEDCFKTIESLGRISQKSKDVLVDEIIKNIEVK